MSAAELEIVSHDPPVKPPQRKRVTEALAKIIHGANNLEHTRQSLMVILPALNDEEVKELRDRAIDVNNWSWVVECACDAEMFRRIKAQPGGRGKTDKEALGRVAAVNREAYLKGQKPQALYRNAQIFQTFKTVLNVHNSLLQDKGFYEAGLRAPDPEEAIEMFAEQKAKNPFFGVRDALRLVKKIKEEVADARRGITRTFGSFQRKALLKFIEFVCFPAIEKLKSSCPDPRFASNILQPMMDDLQDALDVIFIEDAKVALPLAYDKGRTTDEDMAKLTLLPKSEIHRVMNEFVNDGLYVAELKVKVTPQQRGTRLIQYRKVSESPGSAFEVVRPRSNYEATPATEIDWGLD